MHFTAKTILTAGLMLCPLAAQAQDLVKQTTDEVKVTATKVERAIEEVPYSVDQISNREIERRHNESVAEALRDIPGVQVTDTGAAGVKRISIRGESAARVLILIDGQKLSEQKSMDGAALLVDPALVERIEVIKGPASVLYGSEAIGGVVNIITKKGGSKPVQIEAGVTFDSATSGWKENISLFGKVGRVGYRFSGVQSDQKDIQAPQGKVDGSAHKELSGKAYLDYQWDNATLAFSYEKYNNDIRVHTPAGTTSSTMPYFYQDLPEWSREKFGLSIDIRKLPKPLVKLSASTYYQNTYKDFLMDMDVKPTPAMTIQTRNRTQNDLDTFGFQLQADWLLFNNHYLVTGVDFSKDWLTADETRRRRVLPMSTSYTTTLYKDKAESDAVALYLQDEWSITNDLILTAGLRQTWVSTALTSATDPLLKTGSNSDDNLVFSAGVTWNGISNTSLRMLYSQGYRNATLQQLYMGTVHGSSSPTYGNPDLKPEESQNIEVGVRYKRSGFNLDLAMFGSETKNLITTTAHPTVASAKIFSNVDKAISYGAEASASYLISALDLTPYTSVTWLERKFESASLDTWKTGLPTVQGKFGLLFEQNRGKDLGYHLDLYGRYADRADQENSDGSIDRYPGWMTLNLGAGVRFGEAQKYKLSLNLNNILDKQYVTAGESVPMAGASVSASFNMLF